MPANAKSRTMMAVLFGLLLLFALVCLYAYFKRNRSTHASMADLADARQIKLILDSFAMDNDGLYPSRESAAFYELPDPESSNDAFRQLFAADYTRTEKLFWIADAAVCNPDIPDDVIDNNDRFDASQCLKPGDNGWSYFTRHSNIDNPGALLLVAAFRPDGLAIDPAPFGGKVLTISIDGSANFDQLDAITPPLDPQDPTILHPIPK